jgi:hypothetical protein
MATEYDAHAWNRRNADAALAILKLYRLHHPESGQPGAPMVRPDLTGELAQATIRAGAPRPAQALGFVPSPGGRHD